MRQMRMGEKPADSPSAPSLNLSRSRTTLVLAKLGVITAPYLPVDVLHRVEPATPYAATSIAVTVLWPQVWWVTKKAGTWAKELCCTPVDAWIEFTDNRREKIRQRKQHRSQDVPEGEQLTVGTAEENQTQPPSRGDTSGHEAQQAAMLAVSGVPAQAPSASTPTDAMVE
ncbi:hypothetical protein [Streptomyces sp. NBC_00728]|uniref:hypothetical protein n=1 Tax=Streptomyces sp. NBC_00728 TaxID=2903676 RepID=UPI00386F5B1D